MTDESHRAAIAAAIIHDARERDEASARFWETERRAEMLEHLAAIFRSQQSAIGNRQSEIQREPSRLCFDGQKFERRPLDDDKLDQPQKWPSAREAIHAATAERDFLADCREQSGDPAGPKAAKQKKERAELLAQSHELAQRLEAAGVPAYRKDGTSLWVYWICSGEFEELAKFRRICFLPSVAAAVRASKLAALEFFISKNPFARFWTFTSGPRVGLAGLRARVQWLHRRLNALNHFLRRRFAVEIVFRSTELGTIEIDEAGNRTAEAGAGRIETDQDGNPLFHPHAHCVVQSLRGFIPPDEWRKMFAEIWDFWRDDDGRQLNWDGGQRGKPGVIRNARECAKYVCKPGDLLKLTGAALRETEAALHGLKLVQPLGELKREIARRKAEGKVLVRKQTPDGCVWVERLNWNQFAEETAEEREFAANVREAKTFARETAAAARTKPGTPPAEVGKEKPWCRVFARLAPAVGPRWVKEPRAVVGGNVFDAATVSRHPLVARLWAESVQGYEAGLAVEAHAAQAAVDSIRVHTDTPTARRRGGAAILAPAFAGVTQPGEPGETWENARPVPLFGR